MNAQDGQPSEQTLIALYVQTTGASEASARNVCMFLDVPKTTTQARGEVKRVRVEPDLSEPPNGQ